MRNPWCRCRLPLQKNILMPLKRGHGSVCFPKHADGRIKKQVSRDGIILILRLFNVPCTKLFYGRAFRSQSAATRSATHLQRIYWNPVTISALFKSFSVTAMFQPLWFTPTSSTAAVSAFKALSTECDPCRGLMLSCRAVIKGMKADCDHLNIPAFCLGIC